MNVVPVPIADFPAIVAIDWLATAGFYILSTDGVRRSFVDPDDCMSAMHAALDPRLDVMPEGNA
jgi:hypothetical protein